MISWTCSRTASSEMRGDSRALAAAPRPREAEGLQGLGRDALTLMDQPEQDVLGADVVVVEHPGLLLGQDDDAAGAVGESLEHERSSRAVGRGTGSPPADLSMLSAATDPAASYPEVEPNRYPCASANGAQDLRVPCGALAVTSFAVG